MNEGKHLFVCEFTSQFSGEVLTSAWNALWNFMLVLHLLLSVSSFWGVSSILKLKICSWKIQQTELLFSLLWLCVRQYKYFTLGNSVSLFHKVPFCSQGGFHLVESCFGFWICAVVPTFIYYTAYESWFEDCLIQVQDDSWDSTASQGIGKKFKR